MSTNPSDNNRANLSGVEQVPGRTEAEEKLWKALLDKPGGTAAELSAAAGIGKSTGPKILTRWHEAGHVARMSGIAEGGRRAADRWSVQPGEGDGVPPTDEPPAEVRTDGDGRHPEGKGTIGKSERLAPGALRGMVEDHLREHPAEAFTPTALGKALKRSSGAVANALEKLVAGGYVVRVGDKPRKYSITDNVDGDAGATSK